MTLGTVTSEQWPLDKDLQPRFTFIMNRAPKVEEVDVKYGDNDDRDWLFGRSNVRSGELI